MEYAPSTQKSYLHRMAPELICAILCSVEGLDGLLCAILSCHLFYSVFSRTPSAIIHQVFFNELNTHHVRREAIATLYASKLALVNPTISIIRVFFQDHFQQRKEFDTQLTIEEAAGASRLHAVVSSLAEDFSKTTFPELAAACGHASDTLELLASEKARIMRALYMAETFFNLFRTTSSNITEAVQRQCMNEFLVHFAPLEIEQLACIHDFLFRKVSPVFNDVAAHDVLWGEFQVEPALWLGSPELQFFLFKGLGAIRRIAAAKTYAEQQKLFNGIPGTRHLNLHRALKDFSYKESTTEDDSIPSFATSEDYDQGPFLIWKRAQKLGTLTNRAMLRSLGYVMWNQERLDNLGILQEQEWQLQRLVRDSLPNDSPVHEVTDERWLASWRERSRIHEQGGTGWWDFDDESQVVWPERKRRSTTDNTPTSLDEAKRAILALKRV
ncbi:unnamed protein product [Clonostachys rhizophaga]|uniref:Uncharacterized protein n=1 Tax=Clonostachys rhizophaga TaxID=160324 RepID=A0A9N9YVC8_9HYPO|nr:unnamed protein product [Clonostachys rhizophaga]